ncbi:MAG: hypothetical protein ABFS09_00875 [Thermodesulfobacteriota bacterium]
MTHRLRKIDAFKTSSCLFLCGILLLCLVKASLAAQDQDSHIARRLRAGLDLFPSFLAADLHIKDKLDKKGYLILYVVHHNDKRTAQKIASKLLDIKAIKGAPLKVIIVRDDYDDLQSYEPAAIFIAQPQLPHLPAIVNYGKQKSIITFSPFVGDVNLGVTGSISVTARILPQVNMTTLGDSKLNLKPFFLRIASRYPEVEIN